MSLKILKGLSFSTGTFIEALDSNLTGRAERANRTTESQPYPSKSLPRTYYSIVDALSIDKIAQKSTNSKVDGGKIQKQNCLREWSRETAFNSYMMLCTQ